MTHSRVLILGSGPAGYTAAIYAGRANLRPTLITGLQAGGQLMTTTYVENWPGDIEVMGPDLMERMEKHAEEYDTNIIRDHIHTAELTNRPFMLIGDNDTYTCNTLIVATGSTAKYIGLPSEEKYLGRGVSACATCDGFFFKDQEVAVVGGGNTAVEEALYLSNIAKKVTLIHRRDKLRAEEILQDRLFARDNIMVQWNSQVKEIVGDEQGVTGLMFYHRAETLPLRLNVTGVFIAIGHTPNTDIFKNQLIMPNGYLQTNVFPEDGLTSTSRVGVFAAGDVMDNVYRQAVTSAGTGCMAALDVERFLQK